MRKNGDSNFAFTMGSFDGIELFKLEGLYIPHILGEKYKKHRVSLYHDDGFTCFEYTNGLQVNINKKGFIKIFREILILV